MFRIQTILFWAMTFPLASIAPASDWPNFRGSEYDGISDEKLPNKDWKTKPPKEIWRIELGDDGYAGPSVVGGKLFILDHKENRDMVRAVDLKTGKNAWNYGYEDTDKAQYGFAHATPTYDSGRIYTLSRLGLLNCLKADDGSLIWKRDIKAEFGGRWVSDNCGYAASPMIDGEKLIVLASGPGALIVALDKNTGQPIWKGGGSEQAGYATPVKATIGGKAQYVIFSGMSILGVDAQDGVPLWSLPWRTSYGVNASTPLVLGNTVFISAAYGVGCELIDASATPPKILWENKALKAHFNTPILFDGHIYGIGDPDHLRCIVQATGEVKWSQPGFQKGGVIGIDGMIIAINGSDGDVVLCKMSPEGYAESGRIKPLGGQSWTAPVISGGKLFVRNRSTLVCLDLNP